jgi:hypothetical protein
MHCSAELKLSILLSSGSGRSLAASDEDAEMGHRMKHDEIASIKRVINHAYVDGVHTRQDILAIRSGFHREFRMMVRDGTTVRPVMVDEWLARVDKLKADNRDAWSEPTSIEYEMIDVTGQSAVVKLHVLKGTSFFSTDYMFLYKLGDDWTIVSKIFVAE